MSSNPVLSSEEDAAAEFSAAPTDTHRAFIATPPLFLAATPVGLPVRNQTRGAH